MPLFRSGEKQKMTQFQPGQSGNPTGRPKGIKDRRTLFCEMIDPHKNSLLDKAIQMALNGNERKRLMNYVFQ